MEMMVDDEKGINPLADIFFSTDLGYMGDFWIFHGIADLCSTDCDDSIGAECRELAALIADISGD